MTVNFNTLVATNQRHSVARGWTKEEDIAILKEKVSHDAVRLGILTKEDEKEFGIKLKKANRHNMIIEATKKNLEVTEEMTDFEIFMLINSEEEETNTKDEFIIEWKGNGLNLTNHQAAKKFATENELEFAGNISKENLRKLITDFISNL